MGDLDYNVLLLHIEFEDWTPNQVRNWSDRNISHNWDIFRTSTPELLLPAVSLLSFELSIRFNSKDISNITESNIQNYCVTVTQQLTLTFFMNQFYSNHEILITIVTRLH